MIYKEFKGKKLSALGMGCMRLPLLDGKTEHIDEAQVEEMAAYAMAHGVNYYDTAWGYHGGQSELVMGRVLQQYPRDSFYLASKFPGYDLSNMDKVEEIFEKQLEKCRVDHFDFYLIHNVCELNIKDYLDPRHGIMDYLLRQQQAGRIVHLGFSDHSGLEVTKTFLDAYGKHMEFCQIQLNWLDWTFQNAKGKMALLESYGLPVWVMEPVRGGKLARLAPEYAARLQALRPQESLPGWCFRFLQGLPQVKMVLSGMSDLEQLQANIATFETEQPLSPAENEALQDIARQMLESNTLPCTGCRYCTSHCPMELDIPYLLELYNEHSFTGENAFIAPMALGALPEDKQPSACIGCGSCEALCPQQIKISAAMADFAERLKPQK
ncbi:MAG: aldo/keto reductase [Firmicutes bacterium]|nr:aldo/keto reductase [Bacillota bacterium]